MNDGAQESRAVDVERPTAPLLFGGRETRRRERLRRRARGGIERLLRTRGNKLTGEQIQALEAASENDAVLDEIVDQLETRDRGLFRQMEENEPRDWSGFFEALAAFFEKILPLIMQIVGAMGL